MKIEQLEAKLSQCHTDVSNHAMYKEVRTMDELHIFMESHVFAVWDFMSLLKSLQRTITCVEVPWRPSIYPKDVVRMINEIVLGEESDLDQDGNPMDHFTMYLKSMNEVQVSTGPITQFLNDLDFQILRPAVREFVRFNIELAQKGKPHEVAAAFLYGREKLIPDMFTNILKEFNESSLKYPCLTYYLERHIELDGGEHSILAKKCLESLCDNDSSKWMEAYKAGIQSLELRMRMWDEVLMLIQSKRLGATQ